MPENTLAPPIPSEVEEPFERSREANSTARANLADRETHAHPTPTSNPSILSSDRAQSKARIEGPALPSFGTPY
ncbi:hypothetical protein GCM10011404_27330 [Sphingomonas prati]|nr:hypothetical protein GCM10011404_27330 [Sphingomonas prati]